MTQRVERNDEISLNGIRYPIDGPVRVSMASTQAPRMLIGASTKDTHPDISVVVWDDFRGGIGIDVMDGIRDVDRAWWSELQWRQKGQLVLPPLVTATAASGVSGSFDVDTINEYQNVIYAAFGTDFRSYSSTNDAWTSVRTLNGEATDSINIFMGGTEYLVVATTGEYDYYNGSSWARSSSQKTKYLAFWDDRLWGIDADGQLWWATTLGTEVNDAQLPLPTGNVTNLFVGRAPDGDLILYCATTHGLFAHDQQNARFAETELALPLHPDNGLGATRWRDATYISSGLPIHKYVNGANAAVITVMGPDRDHGLPTARRGRIKQLLPSVNDLLALVDATTAPSALNAHMSAAPSNSEVIAEDSGYSHILGWDDMGWESKWVSAAETKAITTGHVSNAYNSYRLWFGQNERVYWMALPRDVNNPDQLTSQTYHAGTRDHELPWFDAGERHVEKLALRVILEVTGSSSNETVAVSYAINNSSSFTSLGTITSDGLNTFPFPNSSTPTGTLFRSIRFKLTLDRGSTATATPNVRMTEFHFMKTLPVRYGFVTTIDFRQGDYMGQSREEMFENLRSAVESGTLVEFTYRSRDADDAGTSNPYNYYVKARSAVGLERTGEDWSGLATVTLIEV